MYLLFGFITKQDRLPEGPISPFRSIRVAPSFAMDALCLVEHRESLDSIINSAEWCRTAERWWSVWGSFQNKNTRRICQELDSSHMVAQTLRHLAEKLSSAQKRSDPKMDLVDITPLQRSAEAHWLHWCYCWTKWNTSWEASKLPGGQHLAPDRPDRSHLSGAKYMALHGCLRTSLFHPPSPPTMRKRTHIDIDSHEFQMNLYPGPNIRLLSIHLLYGLWSYCHWISWREDLHETMVCTKLLHVFTIKYQGFEFFFHKTNPMIWQCVKTLYPCSSHQNSW